MKATGIACCVAGGFAIGCVTLWFTQAYRELSAKQRNLAALCELLQLQQWDPGQARDGPDSPADLEMPAFNRGLYREAVKQYNRLLQKPMNVLPAFLLGFHSVEEPGETQEQPENQKAAERTSSPCPKRSLGQ